LTHLAPDAERLARVERVLARLGQNAGGAARAVPMMLCALAGWHHGFSQIVVVGPSGDAATRALTRELASRYLPFAILVPVQPGPSQDAVAGRLEFVRSMSPRGAAAYVCRDFTCLEPVSDPEGLSRVLGQR
jgi:uncharacterized protein